jgi:hypothetical protein
MLLCAVAATPLAAAPAAAQVAPGPTARTTEVKLAVEGLYDTNVARGRSTVEHSLHKSDEILKPAVAFTLARSFGREFAYIDGSVGYDFYKYNTILNRARINVGSGVSAPIARCKALLTGAYSRFQSDLETLPLVIIQNVEDRETVGLDGDCTKEIGFAPVLTVTQNWTSNSADARLFSDHATFSGTAAMGYSRPSLGSVSAYGRYEVTEFPHRQVLLLDGTTLEDGYTDYIGGIRFVHRLGTRIQGEASVSYTSLQPHLPGVAGFNGVTYSFDVTYRPTGRIVIGGQFSKDARPSNRTGSSFFIDTTYAGDVSYRINPRMELSGNVSRSDRNYGGPGAPVPTVDLTSESVLRAGGALRVDLGKRFSLRLHVDRERRDAIPVQFSYSSTRVGLSLAATL